MIFSIGIPVYFAEFDAKLKDKVCIFAFGHASKVIVKKSVLSTIAIAISLNKSETGFETQFINLETI